MFEKEFREWFESNKKWLFSSNHLQAAYFAWCAGIQQQQAAQQSVQPTLLESPREQTRCDCVSCQQELSELPHSG